MTEILILPTSMPRGLGIAAHCVDRASQRGVAHQGMLLRLTAPLGTQVFFQPRQNDTLLSGHSNEMAALVPNQLFGPGQSVI